MTNKMLPPTNRRALFSLLFAGLAGKIIVEAAAPSSRLRRGVAGIKEQHFDNPDRRNLQDCSSITKTGDCKNTSGCQWAGKTDGCVAVQTPPPSSEPTPGLPTIGSTPQPTSAPTEVVSFNL